MGGVEDAYFCVGHVYYCTAFLNPPARPECQCSAEMRVLIAYSTELSGDWFDSIWRLDCWLNNLVRHCDSICVGHSGELRNM